MRNCLSKDKNCNSIMFSLEPRHTKTLFPNNKLQERHENLISMYLKYGDNFIKSLISTLNPLDANFVILEMDNNQNG